MTEHPRHKFSKGFRVITGPPDAYLYEEIMQFWNPEIAQSKVPTKEKHHPKQKLIAGRVALAKQRPTQRSWFRYRLGTAKYHPAYLLVTQSSASA